MQVELAVSALARPLGLSRALVGLRHILPGFELGQGYLLRCPGLVAWRIIAPAGIVAVDRHFVMAGIALTSFWVFLGVCRSKVFAGWSIAVMAATAVAAVITAEVVNKFIRPDVVAVLWPQRYGRAQRDDE